MSFDSTFDYSGALTFLTDQIENSVNVEIGVIESKLTDLNAIPSALNYITLPEIQTQTNTKTALESTRSTLQGLISEIGIVTSLPTEDKTMIYDFYTNSVGEPLPQWMGRMLYNSDTLVTQIANLTAETLTSEQASMMAEYICNMNPIHVNVYRQQLLRQFPDA